MIGDSKFDPCHDLKEDQLFDKITIICIVWLIVNMQASHKSEQMLVLGCGENQFQCQNSHKKAITIDILSENKPTIVHDLSEGMPNELVNTKFDSIVLEYFPLSLHRTVFDTFKNALNNDGVILLKGFGLEDINLIRDYEAMFYSGDVMLLVLHHSDPKTINNHLWSNTSISTYLQSCGIAKNSSPDIYYSKNNKYCYFPEYAPENPEDYLTWNRQYNAWKYLVEFYSHPIIFNSSELLSTIFQLNQCVESTQERIPLVYGTINKIVQGYQPGWWRSNVTGPTQCISDIQNFLKGKNPLDEIVSEDRIELSAIIHRRVIRMQKSMDLSRSIYGETTRVMKTLSWKLLISDETIFNCVKENQEEKVELRRII